MKLVKEHINFKKGLNPKDAMNIGLSLFDKTLLVLEKQYGIEYSSRNEELIHIQENGPDNTAIDFEITFFDNEISIFWSAEDTGHDSRPDFAYGVEKCNFENILQIITNIIKKVDVEYEKYFNSKEYNAGREVDEDNFKFEDEDE